MSIIAIILATGDIVFSKQITKIMHIKWFGRFPDDTDVTITHNPKQSKSKEEGQCWCPHWTITKEDS